jgi:hypothetical protein
LDGKELIIWKVGLNSSSPEYRGVAGAIVAWTPDKKPIVKTKDSVLVLLDYEWVGGEAKLRVGSRFQTAETHRIQLLEDRIRQLELAGSTSNT